MFQKEKKLKEYIARSRALQLQKIEESLAAGEAAKPLSISFGIPGTKNEARVIYSAPRRAGERHALQLGVLRTGTDRFYSNYMKLGSDVQEIRTYLQQESAEAEWLEALRHLSDDADDFWD